MMPSLSEDATPDAFAAAMVACQGYAPHCSDINECAHGGECFVRGGSAKREAIRKLNRLIADEANAQVSLWLRAALQSLKEGT